MKKLGRRKEKGRRGEREGSWKKSRKKKECFLKIGRNEGMYLFDHAEGREGVCGDGGC
jgi:hypothetical protein